MTSPASQPRPGSGDRIWKVVVGCGLAFGLVALVGLGFFLYGVYWALSPGRQMPTALVVGQGSVGVVRLERGDSDRGMQELVETLMEAIQRAQLAAEDRNVPPFMRSLRRLQLAQSRGSLGMWIPREVTLSIEAGPEPEGRRVVGAVNLRGLVRPMGMMIGHMMKRDPKARVVAHGGHEVVVNAGGSALSFAEGTLLFGSDAGEVTKVLDRWTGTPAAVAPLPASIGDLGGRFDVYGALHRAEEAQAFVGVVTAMVGGEKPEAAATEGLRSARFGLDAETADEARAMVELVYETPEAAEAARQGLAAVLSGLQAGARARGASMEVSDGLAGPRLTMELRVIRLESAIQAWADELMRREE